MQIQIRIFTTPMSHSPERFIEEFNDVIERIKQYIASSVLTNKAGAIGKNTFLDDNGYILATIEVRRDSGA